MKNIIKNTLAILFTFLVFHSCTKKEYELSSEMITSPALENSAEPNLVSGADGNLYMSWVEKNEETAVLKYSKWENSQWTKSEVIAEGNDWFVNWADYPALAVNKAGDMVAHYLQMSDTGSYTYDIKVVAKKSGANNWSAPIKLHRDSVNAEHGFVSIMPMKDGQFFFAWLDGRNTVSSDPAHAGHHGHGGGGPMTIRTAIISSELNISEEAELDNSVCDCCQTGVASTNNGPVVVYRDRSDIEIRDMSIVRMENGSWTSPKTIYNDNWNIAGCPVNGPRIAANGTQLAIAWFSAAEDSPQVKLIFSKDAGATFEAPIQLDKGKAIGRVDVEMIDSETAFVSWMEGSDIVAAKVSMDGSILKRYDLAISKEARNSGFPQIALVGNKVMLAWTDAEIKKVKTKLISL